MFDIPLWYTTKGSVGWSCVAHLSFCSEETLYIIFHTCFLPNCCSFGYPILFRNQPIRNENCLWCPRLWTDWDKMNNLYREPSIHASDQVSVHLAKRFQRRFLEIDQPETRIGCGGHVFLANRAEMSNFYKGSSIDASYQVSVNLGWQFQSRKFLGNRQIRNKNCL